jgi:triacylglycerol lipase
VIDPRERIGSAVRTTHRGVRAVLTPTGIKGAATEIAWVAAHGAMYPWGLARDRRRTHREELDRFTLSDLPPVQRGLLMGDVVAAGTPIILLHGLVDNGSIFVGLRRTLRRRGFGRVITFNYSPFTSDLRRVAEDLGGLVERTCAETGYERVHVVGHSLGGLIARYYVQRLGGDGRVHTLCTLGTPHRGTFAANLLPQRVVRQLRPSSELIAELDEPAPGLRTRFVAFWSDLDQLIVPKASARLEHPDLNARNIEAPGVGHMSLPINGKVVREITSLLAFLDEDGSTVTAGVTPIASAAVPARQVTGRTRSRRAASLP